MELVPRPDPESLPCAPGANSSRCPLGPWAVDSWRMADPGVTEPAPRVEVGTTLWVCVCPTGPMRPWSRSGQDGLRWRARQLCPSCLPPLRGVFPGGSLSQGRVDSALKGSGPRGLDLGEGHRKREGLRLPERGLPSLPRSQCVPKTSMMRGGLVGVHPGKSIPGGGNSICKGAPHFLDGDGPFPTLHGFWHEPGSRLGEGAAVDGD